MEYWVLQNRGDPQPYGLSVRDEHGDIRRYVAGRGLVYFPPDADEIVWGEPGGRQVSAEEWAEHFRNGVGGGEPNPEGLAYMNQWAHHGVADLPVGDDGTVG